jgi:hypothetical protein
MKAIPGDIWKWCYIHKEYFWFSNRQTTQDKIIFCHQRIERLVFAHILQQKLELLILKPDWFLQKGILKKYSIPSITTLTLEPVRQRGNITRDYKHQQIVNQ